MGLRINQNIAAMNSYRNLSVTDGQMSKSLEKLSSGFRINRAADDAAGLAISEKLRGQVNGLNKASENAQNGISLIQTAEGALNETHSILQRMRELSVQSANDTNTTADRQQIQKEVTELSSELDRIAGATQYNTQQLLDGSASSGIKFQVGANANQEITLSIGAMDLEGLNLTGTSSARSANGTLSTTVDAGVINGTYSINAASEVKDSYGRIVGAYDDGTETVTFTDAANSTVVFNGSAVGADGTGSFTVATAVDVTSQAGAKNAITAINNAIELVSGERATLGATQNRLEHTVANLGVAAENLAASESRIRDTDMAKEMMSFTRSQILSQAGTAMLAQANQAPQGVLSLLR